MPLVAFLVCPFFSRVYRPLLPILPPSQTSPCSHAVHPKRPFFPRQINFLCTSYAVDFPEASKSAFTLLR